jgi:hypothetical protein
MLTKKESAKHSGHYQVPPASIDDYLLKMRATPPLDKKGIIGIENNSLATLHVAGGEQTALLKLSQ